MKGILGDITCPECGRRVHDKEFDEYEDVCIYCLYEGIAVSLPVKINHRYGDERNTTAERELLDNLEHIPIKKSDKENERKRKFEYELAMKRRK